MKTKLYATLLAFVMLASLSFTSCTSPSDSTPSQLGQAGAVIKGGATNNIQIYTSEGGGTLAASKALLSTVSIYSSFEISYTTLLGTSYKNEAHAGSGVIYQLDKSTGDAYIITNYHVVYDKNSTSENGISTSVAAYLYGQEASDYAMKAEYIGGSMLYDIAVLKVSGSRTLMKSSAEAASVSNSDEVSVLETAIVLGNPAKLGISATVGTISVESEYIALTAPDERTETTMRVIRTDAPINGGNSGGGLFNIRGELIGIVNAKISSSEIENIGYAIPSNVAVGVAESIIASYNGEAPASLKKYTVGITNKAANLRTVYNEQTGKIAKEEDVVITNVQSGSPADGILKTGDVIKSVTLGEKTVIVTQVHKVSELLLAARAGDIVSFRIIRDSSEIKVNVILSEKSFVIYN